MSARISEVVEKDYIALIKKKMEAVYGAQAGNTQDRGSEKERREKEQRSSFMVRKFLLSYSILIHEW